MNNLMRCAALPVIIVLTCVVTAQTPPSGVDKARQIDALLQQDKLTLHRAIVLAERVTKGEPLQAVSDVDDQGRLIFHIHCFANNKLLHVFVDGRTRQTSVAEAADFDDRPAVHPAPTTPAPPSAPPAKPSAIPTITLAELEFKGKDYLQKRVAINGCRHIGGSARGDQYSLLLSQDGHTYGSIFVGKDAMADVLVQLKSGTTINIEGIVQVDQRGNSYTLACDRIDIVP